MLRRLPLLFGLLLVLTACPGSGAPETLFEQPGQLDPELASALPSSIDTEAMPLFQRNYLEGCLTGGAGLDPALADIEREGLGEVCLCTYDDYAEFFTAEAVTELGAEGTEETINRLAYDKFSDADDRLRDGEELGAIADGALLEMAARCIRTAAGVVG